MSRSPSGWNLRWTLTAGSIAPRRASRRAHPAEPACPGPDAHAPGAPPARRAAHELHRPGAAQHRDVRGAAVARTLHAPAPRAVALLRLAGLPQKRLPVDAEPQPTEPAR